MKFRASCLHLFHNYFGVIFRFVIYVPTHASDKFAIKLTLVKNLSIPMHTSCDWVASASLFTNLSRRVLPIFSTSLPECIYSSRQHIQFSSRIFAIAWFPFLSILWKNTLIDWGELLDIGTWNDRGLLQTGKLHIAEKEPIRQNIDIHSIAETRWRDQAHFKTKIALCTFQHLGTQDIIE